MVSILAHPEGRALPTEIIHAPPECRFQSSPTPKGGRYVPKGQIRAITRNVSILAHPEGRALPTHISTSPAVKFVSILAHPEGRALLYQVA